MKNLLPQDIAIYSLNRGKEKERNLVQTYSDVNKTIIYLCYYYYDWVHAASQGTAIFRYTSM